MLAFHKIWHLYLLHTNAGVYVISGDIISKWRSYYGATFLYNNKLVFKTSMENAFIVFGRAIYMYHPPDSSDICVCVCVYPYAKTTHVFSTVRLNTRLFLL